MITITPDLTNPAYWIVSEINYSDGGDTVTVGTRLQPELSIVNPPASSNDLFVGAIGNSDPVATPFRLVDGCSYKILKPGERCAVMVFFIPESAGTYNDSLNVEFPDLSQSYTVNLTAAAVDAAPEPDINISFTSVNIGSVDPGAILPEFPQLVGNLGNADLDIASINLSGPNAADFGFTENCIASSPLAPNASCSIGITFSSISIGLKRATITITSDDPDESPFLMEMYANVQVENDGVLPSVEDNGLNGGDGDFDNIPDSVQSNVASLPAVNGSYVTLVADPGNFFRDVMFLDKASFVESPDSSLKVDYGILDFSIEARGLVSVGVLLSVDIGVDSFYMYGQEAINPNPHWYEFVADAETGTGSIIWGESILNEQDNIRRNLIVLIIEDGGLGDADLTVNGIIKVQGAVTTTTSPDNSGGTLNLYIIIIAILILSFRNVSYKQEKLLINFLWKK